MRKTIVNYDERTDINSFREGCGYVVIDPKSTPPLVSYIYDYVIPQGNAAFSLTKRHTIDSLVLPIITAKKLFDFEKVKSKSK